MELTVVGCSGSYPGPQSPASCYLLTADSGQRRWRILLDLGNGSLGALHRYADPLDIDAVVFSHLHPDHCLDLCGYFVLRKYHPDGLRPRIRVWGPAGVADRMARAYDLEPDPGMHEVFEFHEFEQAFEVGPFRIEPVPVLHPVPAFALRVEAGGRVLTYSGDTAACAGLVRAAAGADLLLAEASFLDGVPNPVGIHLTGTEAGLAAREAGAARLLVTHIPPWHDSSVVLAAASSAFAGPCELAVPGASYRI